MSTDDKHPVITYSYLGCNCWPAYLTSVMTPDVHSAISVLQCWKYVRITLLHCHVLGRLQRWPVTKFGWCRCCLQPNVDELDRSVNELKQRLMDAKLKAKEPTSTLGVTPPSASRNTTPDKTTHFSPLVRADVRRLKSEDEKSDSSFGLVSVWFLSMTFNVILLSGCYCG